MKDQQTTYWTFRKMTFLGATLSAEKENMEESESTEATG